MNKDIQIRHAIDHFNFDGTLLNFEPFGQGHINDTYAVRFEDGNKGLHRYILQRINTSVFTNPAQLMANIKGITSHLRQNIAQRGGNPERGALTLVSTLHAQDYYQDPNGEYWRAFIFIENTICPQTVDNPAYFYHAARAFGQFQMLLNDYPAETLHCTIPDFHNTYQRFVHLQTAITQDKCQRAATVQYEIEFVMQHKTETTLLTDAMDQGMLPLRVTHNDTKLNNVMLDDRTGEAVCVIDLDTVMPGLTAYDYGDAIRFGASSAAEDEQDLSKVWFDLELAAIFSKGFLETAGSVLTKKEIEMLPWGIKLMTLECGMRFLTDYLNGDQYFKTHYPGQNLDRCRTQFKLVADLEKKWLMFNEMIDQLTK